MTVSSSPSEEPRKSWMDLINESVHTTDDIDIGDIMAVSRDFVVVKRGFVNVHYYYIPISKVEGWDGHVLWLKVTESEVKGNYERDKTPDPLRYYVKDYPYYSTDYYPQLTIIPSRYTKPDYPTTVPPASKVPRIFKCDLCNVVFSNEDELSNHISGGPH
ncbi:MAG: C2H2-type zinc finger protein [Candidatus Nitrosopolaris sp.]